MVGTLCTHYAEHHNLHMHPLASVHCRAARAASRPCQSQQQRRVSAIAITSVVQMQTAPRMWCAVGTNSRRGTPSIAAMPGATSSADKPKGFGARKPPMSQPKGRSTKRNKTKPTNDQQELAAAMQFAKSQPRPAPIDPAVAARGRVDHVKVKDWGKGEPEDLGQLEIDPSQPVEQGFSADGPLYDVLGHTLQQLQKQGALRIATPDGAPPTPPLQSWSFSIERYMQYLVDQLTVHSALERSVVAVAAAPAPSAAAVESFAPTATALARSLEVSRDLSAMAIAMPDGDVVRMHPTQQAVAHAELLRQQARRGGDVEAAEEARERACGQVLCHAYALYVTQLTSGMRLGSLADSKLRLREVKALNFFTNYPMNNPLKALCTGLDKAGEGLSPVARQAVLDELPRAFKHATMLMAALAHTD